MKTSIITAIVVLVSISFIPIRADAQDGSTKQRLELIVQTPEIASFFSGLFNDLGIEIQETGEKLTLHHDGNLISIVEGIDPDKVDFVLPLQVQNISNLVNITDDGKIDDAEATRIARVFFTPFTMVTMKNPVLSENRKRKAAGIEDLIQVHLLFPDGTVAASHTLIYVSNQWIVLEGIHGSPKREFKLTQQTALEYQRKVFEAMQTNTNKGWLDFLKWYKPWREKYSVKY